MKDSGLGKKVVARCDKLKNDRGQWDTLWQELADYVMPRKSNITTRKTPDVEGYTDNLYDMTVAHANLTLAAGQFDYLVSGKWFDLAPPVDLEDTSGEARQWYKKCAERMLDEINASNFSLEIHEAFLNRGGFGTAHLHCDEGKTAFLNFRAFDTGSYSVAENDEGYIDTLYVERKWTARQLVQKFGKENVGKHVLKAYNEPDGKGLETQFDYIHAIYPREDDDRKQGKKDGENKLIASVHVLRKDEHVLMVSGYDELPYAVTRFLKWGDEAYGYCPAIEVLPTVKQVNFIEKALDALAEKAAFPPVLIPDGMEGEVDLRAAGITLFDPNMPNAKPSEWGTQGRYDVGKDRVEDKRAFIREAYYVDLFRTLADRRKNMTATEVLELVEEKLVNFSPTFSRLTSEFFNPLLRRIFGMMLRGKKFPDAPQSVIQVMADGKTPAIPEPKIVFVSKIAMALKALENKATVQFSEMYGPFVEMDPTLLDNLDMDKMFRKGADNQGVPSDMLRSIEDRDKLREARAKQQQAAMAMEMAQGGAKAAADMGKASPRMQAKMEGAM